MAQKSCAGLTHGLLLRSTTVCRDRRLWLQRSLSSPFPCSSSLFLVSFLHFLVSPTLSRVQCVSPASSGGPFVAAGSLAHTLPLRSVARFFDSRAR